MARPLRSGCLATAFGLLLVLFAQSIVGEGRQATLPGPPQQPVATVTGNHVVLRWGMPLSGAPAIGYIVEASLSPGGASVARLTVDASLTLAVAAPSGVYYVRVRAVSAAGQGPPSSEVAVSVGLPAPCSAPPTAPRSFVAAVDGNRIRFTWQAPASGDASRYEIRAGAQPGARTLATVDAGPVLSFDVAAPPGIFYVAAIAINGCGSSEESSEVVVTVRVPGGPPCPRLDACIEEGAIVLSYRSYAEVFPNGVPGAPNGWRWEQILADLDRVVDIGGYDFVVLFTKTALPGTAGPRLNSGAHLRSQGARNNHMDVRYVGRRYSTRDFGPRLKAMPFLDSIGRDVPTRTIFHEMGHFWPVAPAYMVIDRTLWDPRTDPVAWLATSCDPQGHWCGPWYSSPTGPPLPDIPGLMGGRGARFNPFDLHVMGLMGYRDVSQFTYYVEAPPGLFRRTPERHPITQDSIIASRRLRYDATYYVEGNGRRIPDTDPEMADVRALVVVVKQSEESLTAAERAILRSTVLRLPPDWLNATWGRSNLTTPLLLRAQ